jgi:hypothetical protein
MSAGNPDSGHAVSAGRGIASALVDDWQAARRALREIEEAEHPNITDALGRVWQWKDKDLYTHDSMAWPRDHVMHSGVSLPSQAALDNPNYQWCSICKAAG